MKKISVVMATYNGEKFLNKQIESILGQTIVPDEIIVTDDKSTDKTLEILNSYAEMYGFFKVFQNENRLGPIKNFEKCLKISTGDFIFFSDQDDEWDKTKIEKMVSFGKKSDLLYSDASVIDENNNIIYKSEISDYHLKKPMIGNCYFYFMESNCVSGHNIMISRRFLDTIKYFPYEVMYDQFLSFACSLQFGIDYIDEKLCYHRVHSNNFINNNRFFEKDIKVKKKNSIKNRKNRYINIKNKYREFFSCIKFNNMTNEISIFIDHFNNYEKIFFDYRLFKILLSKKDEIYPESLRFKKLKKILRFCRGLKGYWLPS